MKLSLFSVSYAGFWGQHTLAPTDFIAKAAQLGYESVMLMGKRPHLSPLDDVTLAVQNHHDIGVHTDAMVELVHDVDRPNCNVGFDAWSPALRGEDLYHAALCMAPHAVITTNADYVRLPRFRYRPEVVNYEPIGPDMVRAVPFGKGFIDYEAFFSGLREGGFSGIANYEMCSPIRGGGSLENLDAFAAGYIEWMHQHVLD